VNKQQLEAFFKLPQTDWTIEQIDDVLGTDESFWPQGAATPRELVLARMAIQKANSIPREEIVQDAIYLAVMKWILGQGPGLFPWIDEIGDPVCREEYALKQKEFKEKLKKFKGAQ
jgi:hypothetical protein